MKKYEKKRLFLGFEVFSNLKKIPFEKKQIDKKNRHMTMLFLKNQYVTDILKKLPYISLEAFSIGLVGYYNRCLFLPKKNPRLVAYQVDFFEKNDLVENFYKKLLEIFNEQLHQNSKIFEEKNNKDIKSFLPHVTMCRDGFDKKRWEKSFEILPLYLKSFSLYESFQNSKYEKIKEYPLINPFEEIAHTADIAYMIRGKNLIDLLYNSFIALCFKAKDFLKYKNLITSNLIKNIDDIVILLNDIIAQMEIDGFHLPFKAVSFNTNITKDENILNWEMIVDV